MKQLIISLFFSLICLPLAAQMDEGYYQGFKVKKGMNEPDIINIKVLELGNGITQFSDSKTKKPLTGTYHIILNRRKYNIANFVKGIPNGDWEEYYNNELYEKGFFKNGKLDGKLVLYNRLGSHRSEFTMKDGERIHCLSYHANGQLKEERFYENDRVNGRVVTYDADGNIIEDRGYLQGKYHGKQMEKNSSGYIETSEYDNGQLVGEYCRLYPTGHIASKGKYDADGKKTGKWIFGERNGDIQSETHYLKDERHGETRTYYKGGVISCIEEYANGKRNGKRIEYDEEPNVISNVSNYVDDKLHGESKVYHKGILWRESFYVDGKKIREKEYEDGKLRLLMLLDENGSMVNVAQYDKTGKSTYKNKAYKKHASITLKEDASGIIDIVTE